jgi:hypothetical protein
MEQLAEWEPQERDNYGCGMEGWRGTRRRTRASRC